MPYRSHWRTWASSCASSTSSSGRQHHDVAPDRDGQPVREQHAATDGAQPRHDMDSILRSHAVMLGPSRTASPARPRVADADWSSSSMRRTLAAPAARVRAAHRALIRSGGHATGPSRRHRPRPISDRVGPRAGRHGRRLPGRAAQPRIGTVALKVIAPEFADDEAVRARFLRESQMAAAIDHPNILPIYEAGEIAGRPLHRDALRRGERPRAPASKGGRSSRAQRWRILGQVASALDAAHAAGLVHRDVKPANVLIASGQGADRSDHAYLTDFGLTQSVGLGDRADPRGRLRRHARVHRARADRGQGARTAAPTSTPWPPSPWPA